MAEWIPEVSRAVCSMLRRLRVHFEEIQTTIRSSNISYKQIVQLCIIV